MPSDEGARRARRECLKKLAGGARSQLAQRRMISERLSHPLLEQMKSQSFDHNPLADVEVTEEEEELARDLAAVRRHLVGDGTEGCRADDEWRAADGGDAAGPGAGSDGGDGASSSGGSDREVWGASDGDAEEPQGIDALVRIKAIVQAHDPTPDDSGLDIDEFVHALGRMWRSKSQQELSRLFMQIDADSDGRVTWEELLTFLLQKNQVRRRRGGASPRAQRGVLTSLRAIAPPALSPSLISPRPSLMRPRRRPPPPAHHIMGRVRAYRHLCGARQAGDEGESNRYTPELEQVSASPSSAHSAPVSQLVYLPDKDKYLTVGRDATLRVWQVGTMQHLRTIQLSERGWLNDVVYCATHHRLALASAHSRLMIYDTNSMCKPGASTLHEPRGPAPSPLPAWCAPRCHRSPRSRTIDPRPSPQAHAEGVAALQRADGAVRGRAARDRVGLERLPRRRRQGGAHLPL